MTTKGNVLIDADDSAARIGDNKLVLTSTGVGNDEYVKLLLHCEGTDGSTAFTDDTCGVYVSGSLFGRKVITAAGSAQIDTDQKKFGTSSAFFTGGGVNDLRLDYPYCSSFHFVDGQSATIDFWVRFKTLPGDNVAWSLCSLARYGVNESWYFWIRNDSGVYTIIFQKAGDGTYLNETISAVVDTWYHIAVVKNVNAFRVYVNGVSVTEAITYTGFNSLSYPYLHIGGVNYGVSNVDGWIDEFRFSQGIARWAENFTPPTSAYGGLKLSLKDTQPYTTVLYNA